MTFSDAATTTDHDDIQRRIHLYCHIVDAKEWHRLGEIFADDGAFVVAGTPIDARGLPAVEKFMRTFPGHPLAHLTTNLVIDIDDDRHDARAVSTVFGPSVGGTASVGRYTDQLIRTARGWRILRRDVVVIERKWALATD